VGADPLAEGASDEAQPADEEREGDGILNEARILVSLVAIFGPSSNQFFSVTCVLARAT